MKWSLWLPVQTSSIITPTFECRARAGPDIRRARDVTTSSSFIRNIGQGSHIFFTFWIRRTRVSWVNVYGIYEQYIPVRSNIYISFYMLQSKRSLDAMRTLFVRERDTNHTHTHTPEFSSSYRRVS